jgi:hypothetical protein
LDGRDFLTSVVIPDVKKRLMKSSPKAMYLIMNLPATGMEFLDVVPGCLADSLPELTHISDGFPVLTIFCYFFSTNRSMNKNKLRDMLGAEFDVQKVAVRHISDCGVMKKKLLATITLDFKVLAHDGRLQTLNFDDRLSKLMAKRFM